MKKTKAIAIILTLILMLGVLPIGAAAAEGPALKRSEIVLRLWELEGSPIPTLTESPYLDVNAEDACYAAVLWASEIGLTDGVGGGRFAPAEEASRAQLAAFLWKRAGKPEAASQLPFSDTAENAWYAPALQWALSAGVIDAAAEFFPTSAAYPEDLAAMLGRLGQPDALLAQLQGSYIELFPEMSLDKYLPLWNEILQAYCESEEELSLYYQMFTQRFMGELYGQEAINAFAADPENAVFNCFFLGDVAEFAIEGNTISGVDGQGRELFRHSYHYLQDSTVTYFGMEMPAAMHVYESDDASGDGFRYFAFSDDTPAGTYHLEFRYGGSLEGLTDYTEGEYAYWLASAISADYDDACMRDCITLFVTENLEEGAADAAETSRFAGGAGTAEDPWQIATAEQLDRIRDDLTAHYVLIDDIDLSAYDNWLPIGVFHSLSDAPEDAEVPHPDYAFTGSFDGAGHTISNLTVSCESPMGAGLFGCISGTENGAAFIGHFTLENVNVSGFYLVGGAVGLQFMNCPVSDIHLIGDNKLTGMQGIGGIVGTGFDLISDCSATAEITVLGDDGACAGLIAGGTTMSSIKNCEVKGGSITAGGNDTWGFGALCGAPWGAAEITDCKVSGTMITVRGENNRLVGGLVGFAGTYDPTAPAQITGCTVEDVTIIVSETTDSVGGLIGAGKEMMEGSDVMSSFIVSGCMVSGSIAGGGNHVDAIVGDPACAVSVDCEGGMLRLNDR